MVWWGGDPRPLCLKREDIGGGKAPVRAGSRVNTIFLRSRYFMKLNSMKTTSINRKNKKAIHITQ